MGETSNTKGWWSTIPGILTAIAGVITALTGLIIAISQLVGTGENSVTLNTSSTTDPMSSRTVNETPKHASLQSIDGWTIIGKSQHGKYFDLKLMVHGDSPAIGRHYDAVEDFRLVQKRLAKGEERGQTITLGMVHRGDSVEIIDLYIETPSTEMVPVWAKLRAVLHKR